MAHLLLLRRRGLAPLVLMTAVVLLTGCGDVSASTTLSGNTTSTTPRTEHLTFAGDVAGTLTTGIDPRPITHENPLPGLVTQADGTYFDPPPRFTQCSTFASLPGSDTIDDYLAVLVGTVNGVEINMDDPAYKTPGTALHPGDNNSGGSVEVYEVGGQNRRWQQVFGPASQEPVIVLHADRASGTVDAWMATTDQSQKSATATLHLQGDWRCG